MYPDYPIIGWIVFSIIFLIIPLLIFVTLYSFTRKGYLSIAVAAGSVLIVGPTFGLFQGHRETVELNQFGKWTNSIVIERKKIYQRGSGDGHWGIMCKFKANSRDYETAFHDDLNNLHPMGDTVRIIYSSRFPKIYALEYEWKDGRQFGLSQRQ